MVTRRSYAVVHAVEEVGILGLLVGRLIGARVVFEKHSDPSSHREKLLKNIVLTLYRRVEAIAIRYADVVIGTGDGLVEQALAIAPRQRVRHIFDIPSSLVESDAGQVRQIKESLRSGDDEVLALYVGSFAVYQGIDLMFESFHLALQSHPQLRLVVVGGSPEQIAARKEWLDEKGIAEAVRFVGLIDPEKLPNYISAADFLLSPRSSGINTPLKLLDYLKALLQLHHRLPSFLHVRLVGETALLRRLPQAPGDRLQPGEARDHGGGAPIGVPMPSHAHAAVV